MSINHGIFLCFNCAIGIHQSHYPVEVSCVKSIVDDQFNNTQLKVMINGGNRVAYEFFSLYDLDQEATQKKYNTHAAQYYRERLKRQVESGFLLKTIEDQVPDL